VNYPRGLEFSWIVYNITISPHVTQAAEAAGVRLILGFQRRFDNNFQAVKRQIEAGAIGGLRTFRIVSRDPAPPPPEYLKTSGESGVVMAAARMSAGGGEGGRGSFVHH
jgi:hypothetical protein